MEAQAWTAVALLGASLIGSFGYLGAHIDALGARIDEQGAPLGVITGDVVPGWMV
jgi:hypothetical protein